MENFSPDYTNIIDAALNKTPKRLPLYEHAISSDVVKQITGEDFLAVAHMDDTSFDDKVEAFRRFCDFCAGYGYDVIPFECCTNAFVQQGKALRGIAPGIINDVKDVENYDWRGLVEDYKRACEGFFGPLVAGLRPGMKAVGGIGNGVFEVIQDFTSFTGLCMLQADDPEAYTLLWRKIGDALFEIWQWFMERYSDAFAVCRFGDDLGFCSATLIAPDDIRTHIIPQYKRIVDLVHSYKKPFLLHSCGRIYEVMDDLIDTVGIDAKHSNEDSIDTFDVWLDKYGDRIGNFGGVEMNVLCLNTPAEVKEYVTNICRMSEGKGGVAIGSGNQIASYVKPECFIAMTEAVREYRSKKL